MMNEDDLKDKTIETINMASDQGIVIDKNSEVTGQRFTKNNAHRSNYFIYDGNDTSSEVYENIKIIGECWNCEKSGTSVICIGVARISDIAHGNSDSFTSYWAEIVGDSKGTFGTEDYKTNFGLIFNVNCH